MNIADRIQNLRKIKGISQEELADKVGVSRQAVSKWESEQSTPDLDKIIIMSDYFEVTTDYILKGIEPPRLTGKENNNFIAGQILYIASTAFIVIGLLCAFGGWNAEQTAESIWGSMIIQVVGIVGYFIAKIISKAKAPFLISYLNVIIILFMPISLLIGVFFHRPAAPYPTNIISALFFCIAYFITIGLTFVKKVRKISLDIYIFNGGIMSYKILLFDLDDTLLDFGANEADSLNKLFQEHGYTFTDEIFQSYSTVNKQLWTDYENGKIDLKVVLNTRFSETMLRLGKVVDGIEWEERYRELLGNGYQLIEGAFEICQSLSASHRLIVITNGVTRTQIKRLKMSGLYDFFETVFTSENIGFQKPSKEFFDYVVGHIKDFNKKEALVIGDSLNTDIKGGLQAGIDTCWLNRKSQKCSDEIQSTYTIKSLSELYDICKPIK